MDDKERANCPWKDFKPVRHELPRMGTLTFLLALPFIMLFGAVVGSVLVGGFILYLSADLLDRLTLAGAALTGALIAGGMFIHSRIVTSVSRDGDERLPHQHSDLGVPQSKPGQRNTGPILQEERSGPGALSLLVTMLVIAALIAGGIFLAVTVLT